METVLVIGIIAVAGFYAVRRYYLKFKATDSCDAESGCSGCGCSNTCAHKEEP